jgi:hypothetical protein
MADHRISAFLQHENRLPGSAPRSFARPSREDLFSREEDEHLECKPRAAYFRVRAGRSVGTLPERACPRVALGDGRRPRTAVERDLRSGNAMFKSRDKRRLTQSADDKRNGRLHPELTRSGDREERVSGRIPGQFDPDPVVQFRWVPWVLALLVLACLLLAAWVWFEILHV